MIFALFLGVAVHATEECVDLGIPPPFNTWFPSCEIICDDPMLLLAAQMFCQKSCGICVVPEYVKSDENCSRQEISYEMEQEIYAMIGAGDYSASAARPCLRMRTHLEDILSTSDELVGTPDVILLCDCINKFDDDFAKDHLNCKIAGHHMQDLQQECKTVEPYQFDACDWNAIQTSLMADSTTSPYCSNFAAGAAGYGTANFDPASVCDCVSKIDPIVVGRTLNCMQNEQHAMDLYTDYCPAYTNPCNREAIKAEMTAFILSNIANGIYDKYATACTRMGNHFQDVLDPATDLLMDGEFADFARICQCLPAFPREFVDEHMRCGLAGHDAYMIWNECSANHATPCENLNCAQCTDVLRCSMNKDGTCKNFCPDDMSCFDDPKTDLTCAALSSQTS